MRHAQNIKRRAGEIARFEKQAAEHQAAYARLLARALEPEGRTDEVRSRNRALYLEHAEGRRLDAERLRGLAEGRRARLEEYARGIPALAPPEAPSAPPRPSSARLLELTGPTAPGEAAAHPRALGSGRRRS